MAPIDKSRAAHYVWGSICDGWRLLDQPNISVIQERVPPGASETMHYHERAHQFFYVLSGQACLELPTGDVRFDAGQGVHVPPGTLHRFYNDADVDVEFLVFSTPSTKGDRI